MSQDALIVTLDGPRSADGVRADDFARVLTAVSRAMRIMVADLGGRPPRAGRWPNWVEEQSRLKLAPTRPGSFVAELTLDTSAESWHWGDDYGERALAALSAWDGEEDSTLPPTVTECLYDAASHLSKGTDLWLGDNSMSRRVLVTPPPEPQALETLTARLHGWLKAVNWDRRTARLYDAGGRYVRLRFRQQHDEEMRYLARQYVEVEGQGEINRRDKWSVVRVEELRETRPLSEPFDLDAMINEPNPKVFDPDNVVTASEPFDVDEFLREIHDGRDVGREDSPE